jgi:hypothetical protein
LYDEFASKISPQWSTNNQYKRDIYIRLNVLDERPVSQTGIGSVRRIRRLIMPVSIKKCGGGQGASRSSIPVRRLHIPDVFGSKSFGGFQRI